MTVAARLRQLDAQATPGPWSPCEHLRPGCDCPCGYRGGIWDGAGEAVVCEMGSTPGDVPLPETSRSQQPADAAFIVTSRNLLPLLADLAEAAEALLDEDAGPPPNRYLETAAEEALVAALARVADQLNHEEGK